MQLPVVSDKYGAPMGRRNTITEPDFPVRFHLQKLRWVDGDYDEGGAYWGNCGGPIFWARGDGAEEVQEMFVRAGNRSAAQMLIRAKFSNATFLPREPVTGLHDLDEFTTAYLECALWSSTEEDGTPLNAKYSIEDIASETLASMIEDCNKFQADNATVIEGLESEAGHDFWLTRRHCGAGFQDGDWPKEAGDMLAEVSHAFGEIDLYIGDNGKLYI